MICGVRCNKSTRDDDLNTLYATHHLISGSRNVRVMSVLEGSRNTRHQARLSAEPPHIVIGNADIVCKLVQVSLYMRAAVF